MNEIKQTRGILLIFLKGLGNKQYLTAFGVPTAERKMGSLFKNYNFKGNYIFTVYYVVPFSLIAQYK